MKEEYRMVKCSTCGHERRGPKIIRLSLEHKQEYMALDFRPKMKIFFLGILASAVISGIAVFIVNRSFIPVNWSSEGRLIFAMVLGIAIYFFLGGCILIPSFVRKTKHLTNRKKEILSYYGITGDRIFEGVDYVIE